VGGSGFFKKKELESRSLGTTGRSIGIQILHGVARAAHDWQANGNRRGILEKPENAANSSREHIAIGCFRAGVKIFFQRAKTFSGKLPRIGDGLLVE
jgi:hypothetical protein